MSKRISIDIDTEYTDVKLTENTTELDIILAVGALFDMLTPETKKIMLPKLNKISELEEFAIHRKSQETEK